MAHDEEGRCNPFIDHGLACTECFVRLWVSLREGDIVPEKDFRGLGCVPEWGIRYPNGTMLLFEFCTESNVNQTGMVKRKVTIYQQNLLQIETKMERKAVVLFVLDVPRERVARIVKRIEPKGPFFFTDYETFKIVPYRQALTAPIYIWGEDGNTYPLAKDARLETTRKNTLG